MSTNHNNKNFGIAWLFSRVPMTWDDVEDYLPPLNREEARRFGLGQLQDPERIALYHLLFARHPGLAEDGDTLESSLKTPESMAAWAQVSPNVVVEAVLQNADREPRGWNLLLSKTGTHAIDLDPETAWRCYGRRTQSVALRLTQEFEQTEENKLADYLEVEPAPLPGRLLSVMVVFLTGEARTWVVGESGRAGAFNGPRVQRAALPPGVFSPGRQVVVELR